MNQPTTDKIRQIIMDQYGCDDTFTVSSTLTGSIILGDSMDALELAYALDEEFGTELADISFYNWQTVQDVFDSVEQAIFSDSDFDIGN